MDVERICRLAKINLQEDEKEIISKQFEDIVNWVKELENVDTSDIKPFFLEKEASLRDDNPEVFKNRDAILKNFPSREFDFVKVKRVIEG